jgi:hypothetical protein
VSQAEQLVKLAADILLPSEDQRVKPSLARRLSEEQAKKLLNTNATPGVIARYAVEALLGNVGAWEPESIWLGLKDKGIESLSTILRNKVMAALTLEQTDAFYYDANIFEDTCLAFNEAPVIVNVLQEASPAQLAWGVYEALLSSMAVKQEPEFDYEPASYTAMALYREGFILAPALLEIAQEALDSLNTPNEELKAKVKERWDAANNTVSGGPAPDIHALVLEENDVDVQVGKLAAVYLYVDEKITAFQKVVEALK